MDVLCAFLRAGSLAHSFARSGLPLLFFQNQQQAGGAFGNRFQAFGASLRQSAQEMSAKAAAQVSELNKKVEEAAK